jgi:hypothetical protein
LVTQTQFLFALLPPPPPPTSRTWISCAQQCAVRCKCEHNIQQIVKTYACRPGPASDPEESLPARKPLVPCMHGRRPPEYVAGRRGRSGWEEIAWPVALALKQSLDVNPALLIPNARNDPTPPLFVSMPRARTPSCMNSVCMCGAQPLRSCWPALDRVWAVRILSGRAALSTARVACSSMHGCC